jgi:phosphoserine phosphatase RsbU/P
LTGGVDDFLNKPVQRDDLIARLRVAQRIISLQAQLLERHQALSAANQRMRADLGAAAQVQRALLPTALPVTQQWNVAWRATPCEELGGDTLNCFAVDEHHLAGYLLDVSGHGVPSALLAVQASRLLQPVLGQGSMLKERRDDPPRYRLVEPERLMVNLADKFPPQVETAQYFTIAYWLAEHATGVVRLGAGGQPPPLHLTAAGVCWIELASSAIGMLPREQCEFAGRRLALATGERLLLYSDGITEASNAAGDLYGSERLAAVAERARGLALDAWLDAMLADVAAFTGGRPPDDELSLLALERR